MKVFAGLYDMTLAWSGRPRSDWYLAGLGVAESVVFPVPVEALLVPMALARPNSWARQALIATLSTVLGGALGYALGAWAWEWAAQWLDAGRIAQVQQQFAHGGVWAVFLVVFVAAFSPIPYKVFTVTAGFLAVAFLPFLAASLAGRGARFYLVAGLVRLAGPAAEPWLRRHVEGLGWLAVALLALFGAVQLWG